MKTQNWTLVLSFSFFLLYLLTFFLSGNILLVNHWTQTLFLFSGLSAFFFPPKTFLFCIGSLYLLLASLGFYYGAEPIFGLFEGNRGTTWLYLLIGAFLLCLAFHLIQSKREAFLCFMMFSVPLGLYITIKATHTNVRSTYFQKDETPVLKYIKEIEIQEAESGLAEIDCIYVVNLDRRKERWEKTKDLCQARGLKLNRFSAIDGKSIPEKTFKELAGPYILRLDSGKIGCLLSHLSILNDAKKRGFQTVWILEDDLQFDGDIRTLPEIVKKLNQLDPQWDILFTDHGKEYNWLFVLLDPRPDQRLQSMKYFLRRVGVCEELDKMRYRGGAHSYILSKRGIEKILNYYAHVYLWTHYDRDIHFIPDIHVYCTKENIVTRNQDGISDTKNNRFFYSSMPLYLSWSVRLVKDFILGPERILEEEAHEI